MTLVDLSKHLAQRPLQLETCPKPVSLLSASYCQSDSLVGYGVREHYSVPISRASADILRDFLPLCRYTRRPS
jgi:hypothetical protein